MRIIRCRKRFTFLGFANPPSSVNRRGGGMSATIEQAHGLDKTDIGRADTKWCARRVTMLQRSAIPHFHGVSGHFSCLCRIMKRCELQQVLQRATACYRAVAWLASRNLHGTLLAIICVLERIFAFLGCKCKDAAAQTVAELRHLGGGDVSSRLCSGCTKSHTGVSENRGPPHLSKVPSF